MVEAVHIPMDCTAVALPALTSPWPCQHLTHWEQWLKSVVWIGTIFSFIAVTFARDKCYSNGSHKLLQLWVVLFSVCLVWLVCLFVFQWLPFAVRIIMKWEFCGVYHRGVSR